MRKTKPEFDKNIFFTLRATPPTSLLLSRKQAKQSNFPAYLRVSWRCTRNPVGAWEMPLGFVDLKLKA
jgi:hypothetical protein